MLFFSKKTLSRREYFFIFAKNFRQMKRVFVLIVALIACASQMFAQLTIYSATKTGTEQNPQYIRGDEITGTTVNIQAGVSLSLIHI